MKVWLGVVGAGMVVGGVAAMYWPAALVMAGLFLIRAYLNLEKSEKDAGKPQ